MRRLLLLAALALAPACGSSAVNDERARDDGIAEGPAAADVLLAIGPDIDASVGDRVAEVLGQGLGRPVHRVVASAAPVTNAATLVIAIGDTPLTRELVPALERASFPAEGYVVRSGKLGEATLVVADGAPAKERRHGNLGALHGAYALLEALGFAFLHPLAPVVPAPLRIPASPIDAHAAPRWDARRIHLHTQHPLELTELLQGFGPGGPDDEAGFTKQLGEWDRFLEWAVANGENGVEWFLLWSKSFEAFADSDTRIARLRVLVERAHAFGLDAGVDAPIAFAQQHSFRLLRSQGELGSELAEIDQRLAWLDRAGWDFYGIESGTSEFTSPKPDRMLAWMNEVAKELDEKHGGKRAFIKIHCSTGQKADGFVDPRTGGPLDVNELPHYADPRLGILPHTVEHYGLTDPAPTYGNKDFGHVRDFLHREVGSRPVMFYPESAYWVSFDVDVPLFLPLYADRRLADLRLLAKDEDRDGAKKMDGQLVFSSGWEWGYWLNDVVAARAAWDPGTPGPQEKALEAMLDRVLAVFGSARADVVRWIGDVVLAEQALLIEGKVDGRAPADITMRNGQGYLQGWETWDDVSKLGSGVSSSVTLTQPDKLGLVDMRNPLHGGPGYSAEVAPLLAEMETRFAELAARGDALRARIPAPARDLFDDLADAMRMTALRARQVHGLYDYVDGYWSIDQGPRAERLAAARKAVADAQLVVRGREQHYRVPAERIAGWRDNPTAYEFGYLWSVRSLYYWRRDEGKAVDHPLLPCYMNIINPVDVAFGEGMGTDAARFFGSFLSAGDQRSCLAEPSSEPHY